jgi:NH3-dependent NAD+ synthetase
MQPYLKELVTQVHKTLTDLGVPTNNRERAGILSKMLDITKQQAWSLLDGNIIPDPILLKKISTELEIDISFSEAIS